MNRLTIQGAGNGTHECTHQARTPTIPDEMGRATPHGLTSTIVGGIGADRPGPFRLRSTESFRVALDAGKRDTALPGGAGRTGHMAFFPSCA